MISWATILFGAAVTLVLVAAAQQFIARRSPATVICAAAASATAVIAWNAILHTNGGDGFFVDAPLVVFPISWQDTGSGVFALAATSVALGLGPERGSTAATTTRLALLASAITLAIDVYLY